MCLQFSETLSHPAFPILITGSYDRTARVWNLETGEEMLVLKGHRRAIRALQFDEVKLVTASMDHTLKVWNWRTGECMRTLEGHMDGVICLNFADDVLASGSVDTTVKIWNFRTGECFVLRGHKDWVNAVQLWNPDATTDSIPPSTSLTTAKRHLPCAAGKLFSASDDGTIRLWDLAQRVCIRQFAGHMGQVQSMRLIYPESCERTTKAAATTAAAAAIMSGESDVEMEGGLDELASSSLLPKTTAALASTSIITDESKSHYSQPQASSSSAKPQPLLVTGSLDNTIKMWDVETGRATRTLFGHIEGVWAVASDKMRLVSGSHDRTIKVRSLFSFLALFLNALNENRSGAAKIQNASRRLWGIQVPSRVWRLGRIRSSQGAMMGMCEYGLLRHDFVFFWLSLSLLLLSV
jgi:F-box and WD-40 domain protein MET30